MLWTCFDGSQHPVSDDFVAKVDADLNGAPKDALAEEYNHLQSIASADVLNGGRSLSDEEENRLDAIVHVFNLNRAWALLRGRNYRELFGEGASLDQVHHNRHTLSCGCVLNFIFDHHKREQAEKEHHAHYPSRKCDAHKHIEDFREHFETALAHNVKAPE